MIDSAVAEDWVLLEAVEPKEGTTGPARQSENAMENAGFLSRSERDPSTLAIDEDDLIERHPRQ